MAEIGHNSLAALTEVAVREHEASSEAARRSLDHAMNAGDALIGIKRQLDHGQWKHWVAEHYGAGQARLRAAQLEIQLAEGREYLKELKGEEASLLTKEAALKLIRQKREPDEQPPRSAKGPAVLQLDDIVLMGDHVLLCGDATAWWRSRLIADFRVPHLLVTDPPYGIDHPDILNDHIADWRAAWELFGGDVAFVFHAARKAGEASVGLEAVGFEIREYLTWDKSRGPVISGFRRVAEPIFYAVRKGRPDHWSGRFLPTVLEYPPPRAAAEGHATPKPVALLEELIKFASVRGDWVYDPFAGSGSTLIAGERTGRRCFAVELIPEHADTIVRRWQRETGKQAEIWFYGAPSATFDELEKRAKAEKRPLRGRGRPSLAWGWGPPGFAIDPASKRVVEQAWQALLERLRG